ncbi:hypothetical protein WJX72_005834 [[Myrmecia] bisecta]|uniref:tRNA-dihydrouridine(47) synthase [NAD(P)(+)] n=1 Tax=[Myrmecia] bisecta TaxID=41462 RepID=A0AAW1P8X1_9CHLO
MDGRTAEELIAKCIAPVKAAHWRKVGPKPQEQTATSDSHAPNGRSDGSGGQGKSRGEGAPGGKGGRQSKKQWKQIREEQRQADLCLNFVHSQCTYGDRCKFNHDIAGYVQARRLELPGECPFSALPQCPYGITCRWATHHKSPDELTRKGSGEDGSIPEAPVALPLQASVGEPLNTLPKDVQIALRRDQYDFSRADATVPSGAKTSALPASDAKMHPVKLYDVKRAEAAVSGQNGLADLDMDVPLRPVEKKTVDFRGKLYLAPLTTVGNLPYRVVCKHLGADITCGEMALGTNLLQAQASEWALLKRHPCEDVFGIQVCGGYSDMLTRMAQLVEENLDVSFVDVNMGCPIDIICNRSAGSALLLKPNRIKQIARSMSSVLSCPLTLKMRKGYSDNHDVVHTFVSDLPSCGVSALTLHGRTRAQRYSRLADWEYIKQCTEAAPGLQIIGNGDIFSYTDYEQHMADAPQLATTMLARGALIKPWLFTEIKERRHWDISAGERLDILKDFCSAGLQHWGSDNKGVETTRRFLLEFLSFLHRYIPAGVLDVIPQKLHWRPPTFYGRNDLETLFGSAESADWVRISEMLLGPVPDTFHFTPKHKSNAYKGGGSEAGMAFEGDAGEENG